MNEAETSDYGTSSLLRVRKGVGRCLGSAHSPLRVLASAPSFGFRLCVRRLCVRRLCVRVCPNASSSRSMAAVAFDPAPACPASGKGWRCLWGPTGALWGCLGPLGGATDANLVFNFYSIKTHFAKLFLNSFPYFTESLCYNAIGTGR